MQWVLLSFEKRKLCCRSLYHLASININSHSLRAPMTWDVDGPKISNINTHLTTYLYKLKDTLFCLTSIWKRPNFCCITYLDTMMKPFSVVYKTPDVIYLLNCVKYRNSFFADIVVEWHTISHNNKNKHGLNAVSTDCICYSNGFTISANRTLILLFAQTCNSMCNVGGTWCRTCVHNFNKSSLEKWSEKYTS